MCFPSALLRLALSLKAKDYRGGLIADAHPVYSHVNELQKLLPVAYAAGALNLAAPLGGLHHGLDDLICSTLVFAAGEEAGGGLDEVSSRRYSNLGGLLYFVYSERINFENDLHIGAVLVADVADSLDISLNVIPLAAANPTVVCDDVEILNVAVAANDLGLRYLDSVLDRPKGKSQTTQMPVSVPLVSSRAMGSDAGLMQTVAQ